MGKGPGAKSGYERWSQGSRARETEGEMRVEIGGDELGATQDQKTGQEDGKEGWSKREEVTGRRLEPEKEGRG